MKNRKALWLILATLMLDAIGVGLVFPIMPDLMARVGADSTADGAFLGGIMMALMRLCCSCFRQRLAPYQMLTGVGRCC